MEKYYHSTICSTAVVSRWWYTTKSLKRTMVTMVMIVIIRMMTVMIVMV